MKRWNAGILVCVALAGPCAGAAPETTKTDELVTQLSHSEFAVREAAQRELEKLPYVELPKIKRMLEKSTDPEEQARLTKIQEVIEDRMVVDPPAISLQIKNATLGDLAAGLAKETGRPIKTFGGDTEKPTYTLDASGVPFWEIIQRCGRQGPMSAGGINGEFLLLPVEKDQLQEARLSGGFMIFQPTAVRQLPDVLTFVYGLAADPRISVIATKSFSDRRIIDEHGAVLYSSAAPADARFPANPVETNDYSPTFDWRFVDGIQVHTSWSSGAKVTFTAKLRLLVGSGEIRKEIADIHDAETVTVGPEALTFSDYRAAGGTLNVKISQKNRFVPRDPINWGGGGWNLGGNGGVLILGNGGNGQVLVNGGNLVFAGGFWYPAPIDIQLYNHPIFIELTDAAGKLFARRTLNSGYTYFFENVKTPVKAVLTTSARAIEVTVPIEVKNFALP